MIPRIKAEFERVLHRQTMANMSVLEVGYLGGDCSLLSGDALRVAGRRVGVNIVTQTAAGDGIEFVQMDARTLTFPDDTFDLVLSSSTLEHIPNFWLAVAEMKRVLKPGGLLLLSMPGFVRAHWAERARRAAFKLRLPDVFKRSTVTMRVHDAPHDYYRFSEYAFRDAILHDLEDVRVWSVMAPPRLFGLGRKPA